MQAGDGEHGNAETWRKIREIYGCLYGEYGPQGWWPAETPFEVLVGAILTQQTAWSSVEKAIEALKGSYKRRHTCTKSMVVMWR